MRHRLRPVNVILLPDAPSRRLVRQGCANSCTTRRNIICMLVVIRSQVDALPFPSSSGSFPAPGRSKRLLVYSKGNAERSLANSIAQRTPPAANLSSTVPPSS